jgi:ATP adenylyltransferase
VNHIWTPWRMKYIQGNSDEKGCVFCLAAEGDDGLDNLVFHRGEGVFMILNRYPYTSGHVMCVPYVHVDRLQDLLRATRLELMDMVCKAIEVLQLVYHPEGFNIGLNLGKVAGAGIADHLHMHIVPRWGVTPILCPPSVRRGYCPNPCRIRIAGLKKPGMRLLNRNRSVGFASSMTHIGTM